MWSKKHFASFTDWNKIYKMPTCKFSKSPYSQLFINFTYHPLYLLLYLKDELPIINLIDNCIV